MTREDLGRIVRETWVKWASEQPDPKPSWLVDWDDLDDGQREADMRIGEAVAEHLGLTLAAAEPPLPEGQYARVELPGYRQHTGWVTEETRFGVQMAVIRDWDGREMAAAVIGANSQVVYLPTPRKRPDPLAIAMAIEASGDFDGDFYEPDDDDDA